MFPRPLEAAKFAGCPMSMYIFMYKAFMDSGCLRPIQTTTSTYIWMLLWLQKHIMLQHYSIDNNFLLLWISQMTLKIWLWASSGLPHSPIKFPCYTHRALFSFRAHNAIFKYISFYLHGYLFHLSLPLGYKLHEGEKCFCFAHMHSQTLLECLEHSKCSVNIC